MLCSVAVQAPEGDAGSAVGKQLTNARPAQSGHCLDLSGVLIVHMVHFLGIKVSQCHIACVYCIV